MRFVDSTPASDCSEGKAAAERPAGCSYDSHRLGAGRPTVPAWAVLEWFEVVIKMEVDMSRSRSDGRRSPTVPLRRAVVVALMVLLLPLTSCATMFTGTMQSIPVTSSPERAEVFVDGVSVGFTPLELRLPRRADVTVEVRLGDRVRSFELQSETQGAMVGLDLVPVGVMGGLIIVTVVATSALGSESSVAMLGLLGLATAPLLVDYGTGGLFELRPGEIVAVFD